MIGAVALSARAFSGVPQSAIAVRAREPRQFHLRAAEPAEAWPISTLRPACRGSRCAGYATPPDSWTDSRRFEIGRRRKRKRRALGHGDIFGVAGRPHRQFTRADEHLLADRKRGRARAALDHRAGHLDAGIVGSGGIH